MKGFEMSKFIETIRAVRDGSLRLPDPPKVWHQSVLTGNQINDLLRRAEHEISYSAKRAIEMYLPVYEQGAAFYLFCKCAEHRLSRIEMDECGEIMAQFGMLELDGWDDKDWMFIVDRFPDLVTVGGYKLHESSWLRWHVSSPNQASVALHAKWSEDTGLVICRDDIEKFEGTNIILRKGPCEKKV